MRLSSITWLGLVDHDMSISLDSLKSSCHGLLLDEVWYTTIGVEADCVLDFDSTFDWSDLGDHECLLSDNTASNLILVLLIEVFVSSGGLDRIDRAIIVVNFVDNTDKASV